MRRGNPDPYRPTPEECARGGENAHRDACRSCGSPMLDTDECPYCERFEAVLGDGD